MNRLKNLFILIALFAAASTAAAQDIAQATEAQGKSNARKEHRINFGVDKDSKDYIIGSFVDNWYVSAGLGLQTLWSNENVRGYRWNEPTTAFNFQLGKWIIPDFAFQLDVQGFSLHGQTRYGRNPYVDFTSVPTHGSNGSDLYPYDYNGNSTTYYEYQNFRFNFITVTGSFILDWNVFLNGYEKGQQQRYHFLTPVGLGCSLGFGHMRNTNPYVAPDGKGRAKNYELCATTGLIIDVRVSDVCVFSPAFKVDVMRGSWDFSPYDNTLSRFDIIPAITMSLKFNILQGRRYLTDNKGNRESINYFVPGDNSRTVQIIRDQVEQLKSQSDSLNAQLGFAEEQVAQTTERLFLAEQQLEAQKEDIQRMQEKPAEPTREMSPMEQIIATKNARNLLSIMVYYPLNKSTLETQPVQNIRRMAEVINASGPNDKFYIIGAADAATGTKEINWRLSVNRCKSIYNVLVRECGVHPSKLEMRPLGGITEYEQLELNRVGIVVLSTDDMTKIVDKYSKRY